MNRRIDPIGLGPSGADRIERVKLLDRVERDLQREERERKRKREKDQPRRPGDGDGTPRLDVRG